MQIEMKTQLGDLADVSRIRETAMTVCQSGEALFRYYQRLDRLEAGELNREAFAERALEAELQTRLLLSAGMDALNEMNDLGLLNVVPTDDEIKSYNATNLSKAARELVDVLRMQMPQGHWDWLEEASAAFSDVEIGFERNEEGLRGAVKMKGRKRPFHVVYGATPQRVSTRQFFSGGEDRVYVPTSSLFASRTNGELEPIPVYDSMLNGFAFAREWMHRHARYAAEVGPPERTGGGPIAAAIAVACIIAGAIAAAISVVCLILCAAGSEGACKLMGFMSAAASALTAGAVGADKAAKQFPYGTNNQT
jgi:hypothetical protein